MRWHEIWAVIDHDLFKIPAAFLFGAVLAKVRGRLRTLEWRAEHNRLGTTIMGHMGDITVTMQGNKVDNIWASQVTLYNPTEKDFTDLKLTVTTDATVLLTEQAFIEGTTEPIKFTPEYKASIEPKPGQTSTPEQLQLMGHRREYVLPVFNRKQRALLRYVATVPKNPKVDTPAVWLSLQHPGVKLQFIPVRREVDDAPYNFAVVAGIAIAFLTTLVAGFVWPNEPWTVAGVALGTGIWHTNIGAFAYHAWRCRGRT